MTPDDAALLDAWADGDRTAAAELTRRHFDGLYGFFRSKLGGEVDDLVQDALLRALETRRKGTQIEDVRAYVFAVARNLLVDRLRQRQRSFDATVTSLADLGPTPSAAVARREQERLLLEALRTIPVDHQILLELYYWEQMEGEEIAAVLGIPHGTVRSRIRRGQEQLRKALGRMKCTKEELESTMTRLDDWAAQLRAAVVPGEAKPG